MKIAAKTNADDHFELSFSDFTRRAREGGSSFWRGVVVSFASTLPLVLIGISGHPV